MQKIINDLGELHKELISDMTIIELADYAISRKITYKERQSLPDAAFAVVYTIDGKKIRKFPHHTSKVKNASENSTVDIPHLRNALARLPQSKIPAKYKSIADRHLQKHAKTLLKTHKKDKEGKAKLVFERTGKEMREAITNKLKLLNEQLKTARKVKNENDTNKFRYEIDDLKMTLKFIKDDEVYELDVWEMRQFGFDYL